MKITQIVVNESIELGDNFDIELGNTVIESRVVGFMDDGVVIEADDKTLALLGISGALLESVDVKEVSLGDYRKKAMLSKGLGQIEKTFGRSPEAQAKGAETARRREAGLARLDARNEKARAANQQKELAELIARLPELKQQYADMRAEYDSLGGSNWQYADREQNLTDKERRARSMEPSLQGLWRQIQAAEKAQKQQGLAEGSSSNLKQLIQQYEDQVENVYGMVPGPRQRRAIADRDALEAQIEALPGGKEALSKWARAYNDGMDEGVAEGSGNIGNAIKSLYQKIYNAGDDEIEYFYHDSPIFAQYWDEYEGDLDSIIAEVDPSELQIMLDELESYVDQANLTEGQFKQQMHVDAERMELSAFIDKYGNEDWIKEFWQAVNSVEEAKYRGRTVPLGKPMQGDVKKFKVYVKNKKGNVIKVNFGDPNMRIKKSNPARRKSFRARHRCATAKDRTSARYWSCRKW